MSVDLARAFSSLGHDVEFWLLNKTGDFLDLVRDEFDVVDLEAPRARFALAKLIGALKSRRPAAVIAMMWPLSVLAPAAALLSRYGGKVLVCEHGMIARQYKDWGLLHNIILRVSTSIGYRLADVRAGVSLGVAEGMASLACLPVSSIAVIPNPVPPRSQPSAGSLKKVNSLWAGKGPRIISVGSFKPVKNYPLLLRSFAKLDLPDACLMLLGRGDGEEELRSLALELGITDRVTFAGFHKDTSPFYATADLFVLSSNSEGLPTVVIEALSFGLRIVSTDCPSGPSEILEGGKWGRLVPVGDEEALTKAMGETLRTAVDKDSLRRRAEDFAPEVSARKYLDLLGLE